MTDYIHEGVLPETLINVPEETRIEAYRGSLGALAVKLSPYKGFPTYEYDIGVVHRDIYLENKDIGALNLRYDYGERKVAVSSIRLDEYKGNGIGIALYRTVLQLPLPSGERPREYGFILESTGQSDDARKVWHRLVEKNEAIQKAKTHFQMR